MNTMNWQALLSSGSPEWKQRIAVRAFDSGTLDSYSITHLPLDGLRDAGAILSRLDKGYRAARVANMSDPAAIATIGHNQADLRVELALNSRTPAEKLADMVPVVIDRKHWSCAKVMAQHANVSDAAKRQLAAGAVSQLDAGGLSEARARDAAIVAAIGSEPKDLAAFVGRYTGEFQRTLLAEAATHNPDATVAALSELMLVAGVNRAEDLYAVTSHQGRFAEVLARLPRLPDNAVSLLGAGLFQEVLNQRSGIYPRQQWQLTAALLDDMASNRYDRWGALLENFKMDGDLLVAAAALMTATSSGIFYHHGAGSWFRAAAELGRFRDVTLAFHRSGLLWTAMRTQLSAVPIEAVDGHPDVVFELLESVSEPLGQVIAAFSCERTFMRAAKLMSERAKPTEVLMMLASPRSVQLGMLNEETLRTLGVGSAWERADLLSFMRTSDMSPDMAKLFADAPGSVSSRCMVPYLGQLLSDALTDDDLDTAVQLLDGWQGSVNELITACRSVRA